jgi:hypothetical protein
VEDRPAYQPPKDRSAYQSAGVQAEDRRQPYQPSGAGIVGIVRGLRQTSLPTGNWEFRSRPNFDWSFRLEQRGIPGDSARALAVHLRGEQLAGDLREGDWVQLPPDWRPGRYPNPKQLLNLTTGEQVRAIGVPAATVHEPSHLWGSQSASANGSRWASACRPPQARRLRWGVQRPPIELHGFIDIAAVLRRPGRP